MHHDDVFDQPGAWGSFEPVWQQICRYMSFGWMRTCYCLRPGHVILYEVSHSNTQE